VFGEDEKQEKLSNNFACFFVKNFIPHHHSQNSFLRTTSFNQIKTLFAER